MRHCAATPVCSFYRDPPLKFASFVQPLQSAAIRLALEGSFLDVIAAANSDIITASDIAQKTGYDELLIGEIRSKTDFTATSLG